MSTPPTPPERPDRRYGRDEVDDPTGMRALLSSLPDPGPMPPDLVDRINAALAAERLQLETHDADVIPLRRRRWTRVALVAAAAAVVAVGIPALVTGTGPGDVTALLTRENSGAAASSAQDSSSGQAFSQAQGKTPSPSAVQPAQPSPTGTGRMEAGAQAVTIYASDTAYTSAGLHWQLQAFIDHPGSPLAAKAAQEPAFGPVSTPEGLLRCLHAVGVMPGERVAADLSTFDGAPAVVLVVSTDTGQRGFVLSRDCATRQVTPLAGPVALS